MKVRDGDVWLVENGGLYLVAEAWTCDDYDLPVEWGFCGGESYGKADGYKPVRRLYPAPVDCTAWMRVLGWAAQIERVRRFSTFKDMTGTEGVW